MNKRSGLSELKTIEDLLTPEEKEQLNHDLKRIHDLRIRAEVESRDLPLF